MRSQKTRRTFFKHLFALSAFSGASVLSYKKNVFDKFGHFEVTEAHAMNNPDYAVANSHNRVKIEYFGMSCFLITASSGVRIINDPFYADAEKNVLHPELRHEPADVVTVSCGHYAHCNVSDVGGMPHIYQITEPAELSGIKFRGVASRHLEMKEISSIKPGENVIMCFEIDDIKFCHLGALGHRLSEGQIKQIGKVDILMVPVGGVSTLSLSEADEVCNQLNPKIIIPMHYQSNRCVYPSWATVDDFLINKTNYVVYPPKGFGEISFTADELPSETLIVALGFTS